MGNWNSVPRKPRNHPSIQKYENLFGIAFHNKEYNKAVGYVILNVFELLGVNGLMKTLDNANKFIKRIEQRNKF